MAHKLKISEELRAKMEEQEKAFNATLEEMGSTMAKIDKVGEDHDHMKQLIDIHKTNEELSQSLLAKTDQAKTLLAQKQELESQVEDLNKQKKASAEETSRLEDALRDQKIKQE